MADLLSLRAVLSLDSTNYEQGLSKAQGAVKTIDKVATVAFAAAGAAAGKFIKDSIDTGKTFDSSMSQVAATMGKTVDQIEELSDFAKEMGETTVFSAIEASEALNYMALAGYDTEKSMRMLPAVLDLAASGNIDLARASDMVTDAESALNLEGNQVNEMIDQMAKAASKSNTSVEQLGDAILTIGGTANLMAGGTDRLATVLGILADNGIKGSEAGTHLRNMILKLSSPTEQGAKAMQELGLQVFDADGKMRDFQEIITDLNVAFADLTDEQKIKYISDMFNARDISSVNALLQTSTERWNELGAAIKDSAGASAQMAHTQLDNLQGDLTLFKSKMEGVRLTVYKSLEPALRNIISRVSQLVDKIDWNKFGQTVGNMLDGVVRALEWTVEHIDGLIVGLESLAIAFAAMKVTNFALGLASAITSLVNMTQAAGSLGKAMMTLNATMAVNPFVLLAGAIAGVVAAIVLLNKHTDETPSSLDALQEASDSFNASVKEQVQALENAQKAKREYIAQAEAEYSHYQELKEELDGLVDANGRVKEGYEDRAKAITSILSDALGIEIELNDGVIEGYENISKAIDEMLQKKKAEAVLVAQERAYQDAIANREKAVLSLQKATETLEAAEKLENMKYGEYARLNAEYDQMRAEWKMGLRDTYDYALEDMMKKAKEEWEQSSEILQEQRDAYKDSKQVFEDYSYEIMAYEDNMGKAAQGMYDQIKYISPEVIREFQKMTPEQKKAYEKAIGYSLDFAVDIKRESTKAGEYLVQGLATGTGNQGLWGQVQNTVWRLGQSTIGFLQRSLHEKSPSKATEEMGKFFVEGFSRGIEDEERGLLKQVSALGDEVVGAFSPEADSNIFATGSMFRTNNAQGVGTNAEAERPLQIVVQSVLDGRIIGENSYNYIKGRMKTGSVLV